MNKQELFDKAVIGVISQGKKSYDPKSSQSRYRTKDGLKCGIGHLIPDEVYDPSIEGKNLYNLVNENHPAIRHLVKNFHSFDNLAGSLLKRIQIDHDTLWHGNKFIEDYKHKITITARMYGLTIPECAKQ